MIRINDEMYENYSVKIEWGSFEVVSSGNRIKGISPFIEFIINDEILIGLETVIDKEQFLNMQINKKVNIERYLTDVTYEDDAGWMSIWNKKLNCAITKISDVKFKIEFNIEAKEMERLDIIIDDNVVLL